MGFFQELAAKKEREQARKDAAEAMRQNKSMAREQASMQDDATYYKLQQDKADIIRWQQDFQQDIKYIRYNFLGEYFQDGRLVKDESITPVCNHYFYNTIIEPELSHYLRRSMTNSFLDEARLNMMLRGTFKDLRKTMVKGKYYGNLYDMEFKDFDYIIRSMKDVMIPAAFRAINGSTIKINSTMIKRIESSEERDTGKQDKKFFSWGG